LTHFILGKVLCDALVKHWLKV